MTRKPDVTVLATAFLIGVGSLAAAGTVAAQTAPAKVDSEKPRASADKPRAGADKAGANADKAGGTAAAKPAARQAKATKGKPEPEPVIADADSTQIEAVGRVYTGSSDCEFNQRISVEPSQKHAGYVELQHGKKSWLMRPVVSSTGAVRLEDVRAEALLIQIGSKTMLLNQKTGQRIVDECRHAKQIGGDAPIAGGGGILGGAPAAAVAVSAPAATATADAAAATTATTPAATGTPTASAAPADASGGTITVAAPAEAVAGTSAIPASPTKE